MKKLLVLSAVTLFSACSPKVSFESLMSVALSNPVSAKTDSTGSIDLSDYFEFQDQLDSVTCKNASLIQNELDANKFLVSSPPNTPYHILTIWSKGQSASLLLTDAHENSGGSNLFITSNIDNRGQLMLTSNKSVDQWFVLWQNIEIPSSSTLRGSRYLTVPIPQNAVHLENSVLRVLACSNGEISNQSVVYLSRDQLRHKVEQRMDESVFQSLPFIERMENNEQHKEQFNQLISRRSEWVSGDEFPLLDDNEVCVYARTYLGKTSFFAYNKKDTPVKKVVTVPDNIKMGNLKTYFNQSIKQTGEKIVIQLSPNAYEIATSELL
ncbi:MAG: hypothetical protein ACRC9Q_03685 [Bacteroidales bacterium]